MLPKSQAVDMLYFQLFDMCSFLGEVKCSFKDEKL